MRSILKVNWDSNLPIYSISQSDLQKQGIHSLLLDVDGTLVNRKSKIIPLDPFFIVGKLKDKGALLVEDDEFDKIQPLIETELEKSNS